MGNEGSKKLVRDLINLWKLKQNGSPALIIKKLTDIYNVLEDMYSVGTAEELQNALDSIGDEAGTIFIESGTIDLDSPITIDGGGSYVIYGHGDNTILKPANGVNAFEITNCTSCVIKTLKIDCSNFSSGEIGVYVNDANDNVVLLSDVTLSGGLLKQGTGISLQSKNCSVSHCTIDKFETGVLVAGDNTMITNNAISDCSQDAIKLSSVSTNSITENVCQDNSRYGIYLSSVSYTTVSGNLCNSNYTGIQVESSNNNTVSGNIVRSNSVNGVYLNGSSYNTISGNAIENNDSNTSDDTAGIY